MESLDQILEHHGIKGMRWGVRRTRGADGRVSGYSKKVKPGSSADAARAQGLKTQIKLTGGTHSLSNQDLQHLVTRMNLEQQHARLSPSVKSAGAKFTKDVLVQVGKQEAARVVGEAARTVLKS